MPKYFRDDWLNDYHDIRRAAASAAADGGGRQIGTQGCRTVDVDNGNNGTGTEQSVAPESAPSRLADSDYRFVYLGPRVGLFTVVYRLQLHDASAVYICVKCGLLPVACLMQMHNASASTGKAQPQPQAASSTCRGLLLFQQCCLSMRTLAIRILQTIYPMQAPAF